MGLRENRRRIQIHVVRQERRPVAAQVGREFDRHFFELTRIDGRLAADLELA